MSATQKALWLESKFGQFKVGENTVPTPGAGQVLVRVEATGLNPVDWKVQKYGIFLEKYPAILGTDIAGVVEAVGEGVTGFATSDRVLFQGAWEKDFAGYQQHTLSEVEITAKIPAELSYDQAATIPVGIAAAVGGLYLPKPHGANLTPPLDPSTQGKYAGKPIVVLGGATSVGQFAIQFAKLSGFSPIITTASLKNDQRLKALGATHVLDRHLDTGTLGMQITVIAQGIVEVVFDAVSLADTQQLGYDVLAAIGHLTLVLPKADEVKEIKGKSISTVFGVWTLPHSRDLGKKLYSKLTELLESGALRPNRVEVLPGGLRGVATGLRRLEADQVSGVKLVVRPQETA
ncbi:putative alcohol dehydrogenase GroES-like domain [Lyophyllum shimeji]|uniref:Alcohol dehydrogenase GroES-like domain n=1 Tax=Lyophyllum shimeji TaxID=47721 RepID=A0A9P3PSI7_LYOSH|nr:putative alcohol dehydrogenase GroES-like domain [Lyophyllum shimeji]